MDENVYLEVFMIGIWKLLFVVACGALNLFCFDNSYIKVIIVTLIWLMPIFY